MDILSRASALLSTRIGLQAGCLEDISGSFTTAMIGLFYQLIHVIHEERLKNSFGLREVR